MARPKSLIHEYAALRQAATALYMAGPWRRDGGSAPLDRALWDKLRDTLRLPKEEGPAGAP